MIAPLTATKLLLLALGLPLIALIVFKLLWTRPARWRPLAQSLSLSIITCLFVLLAIETYFRQFVIESDNFGFTLVSRTWFAKYYNPINSLGYRDVEHTESSLQEQRVLYVVGDSLMAGQGIKDYRDRLSNILEGRLGDGWAVINIARPGWSTEQELKAIESYPHRADEVLLAYYPNDIEQSAIKHGYMKAVNPPDLDPPLAWIVDSSYAFNYFYWRLFQVKEETGTRYLADLRRSFDSRVIWQEHTRVLDELISYCRNNNEGLMVVIFPFLQDVDGTKPMTSKVAAFFDSRGVATLDLAPALLGRNPDDLIVSRSDSHPNTRLYREVADLLGPYVERLRAQAAARY